MNRYHIRVRNDNGTGHKDRHRNIDGVNHRIDNGTLIILEEDARGYNQSKAIFVQGEWLELNIDRNIKTDMEEICRTKSQTVTELRQEIIDQATEANKRKLDYKDPSITSYDEIDVGEPPVEIEIDDDIQEEATKLLAAIRARKAKQ